MTSAFVWIVLGLAVVVLLLITLYVSSWRPRRSRRPGHTDDPARPAPDA